MPKIKCKRCEANGQCYCMVVDDEQLVNEFTFVCDRGHIIKECRYADERCPFCGLEAKEHQGTPAPLWSKN